MFVLLRYGNCTTNIYVCTQMINVTKIRPNSAYYNDHQAILELLIEQLSFDTKHRCIVAKMYWV